MRLSLLGWTCLAAFALPLVSLRAADGAHLDRYPDFKSRWVASREVDVWLPPTYASHPDARFPVIYMQDGQNLFDPKTSYGGVSWSIDDAMLRLIAAHKTDGAIVVSIWNTPARFAEYMPQKAVRGDAASTGLPGFPAIPVARLEGDAYLRFMVRELKPFVDERYRTAPNRDHTFAMGSSMGGLISLYAVLEYPDVFGGAACLSTHWPAADGRTIDYLAAHLPPAGTHKLYFDYGTATLDAEYGPYQQRADAVLRRAGYVEGRDWITRKFPGAEHSEKSWRQRVDIPLAFLLGGGSDSTRPPVVPGP